jgi:serine/threonine protein phosphatase PrpC
LVPFPDVFTDTLTVAAKLVAFAVDSGGMDNITVILMPFQAVP